MAVDVFISYAHATAQAATRRLREELTASGLRVFLDEREIPYGSAFPRDIADALLQSRLVVVFADEVYFRRPWCVYEFQTIVAPYRSAAEPDDTQLEHVSVVLPPAGASETVIPHLPPPLARVSWPSSDRTTEIADMIRRRLQGLSVTLSSRIEAVNDDAVARLRGGGDVPLPWPQAQATHDADVPDGERPFSVDLAPETRGEAFIGRAAELWRLFHELVTCRAFAETRRCAVQGLGGSGKSQLASEFMARYGERFFPGGLIWISADADKENLAAEFGRILGTVSSAPDIDAQLAEFSRGLSRHFAARGNDVLWVIDGVPEHGAVNIDTWCPAWRHVNVLATSRRRGLGKMDAHLELGELRPASAVELLTRPNVDPLWLKPAEWADLAEWVGGLPLAIAILRDSLANSFTTAEALKLARRTEPLQPLDEMEALSKEVDPARLRGIAEAFEFSHDALDPEARHAAHVVAHLAPYPLAENLLADLVPKAVGVLRVRSWIQVSGGSGAARSVRRLTMHRIPASFLRARSLDRERVFADFFHWFHRLLVAELNEDDARAIALHLMVVSRRFIACLSEFPPDSPAIRSAREFAVDAATAKKGDRGLRFLAAGLAHALGVDDEVVSRLERAYDTGDPDTAAAIPHTLQALVGNPRAVMLMGRLIEDSRDTVRMQALIHAAAVESEELALPLLHAVLKEPSDVGVLSYDHYLSNGRPCLRDICSELARRLREGPPRERARAAQLFGRVLVVNGEHLEAGGFRSRHVIDALLHVALHDDSEDVVHAAVSAASTYFDEETHRLLTTELGQAQDSARRARIVRVMGDYLHGALRPPPPKLLGMEFRDGGGVSIEIDTGNVERLPAGVYRPLLDVARSADAACAAIAISAILDTNEGKKSFVDYAGELLQSDALTEVVVLAERFLAHSADFTSAYWWRGQARFKIGNPQGACDDYSTVISQAPRFAGAYLHRGYVLLCDRQFYVALSDFERAVELDREVIPEVLQYVAWAAEAEPANERIAEFKARLELEGGTA